MTQAKVCVGCLRIIAGLTEPRCPGCAAEQRQLRGPSIYDDPEYRVQRSALVAAAEADESIVCWLCTSRKPPPGYSDGWVADHFRGSLMTAHFGCNSARGGRSPEWFRARIRRRFPDWFKARGSL